MRFTVPTWLSLLALPALLVACTTPRTEILIVTDTNLEVPAEMDRIVFEVLGPESQMEIREADPSFALPATLGLVHEGGPLGPVLVRVVGRLGETDVVMRRARLDFDPERTVVLRMNLLQACAGVTCGAAETCTEDGCASVDVDVRTLPEWTGTAPTLDAMVDARVVDSDVIDSGVVDSATPDADVGPMDSAVTGDTAPPDSGAMDGATGDSMVTDTGTADTGSTDTGVVDSGSGDTCGSTEVCNMMDDDCDGLIDEGFNLSSDPDNCGACGNVCNLPNASSLCTWGFCYVSSCDTDWGNCDGDSSNGCETDLTSDDANCGMCDNRCNGMRTCTSSTCS
ncbi:MAG: hypothetical protein GWO04_31170 [Actinobacteria bacterium]|nr:hypothetical protein [Actinomycetota bacterium]